MALLDTYDLSVTFGGLRAVSDVSLGIDEGNLVGLIGPNLSHGDLVLQGDAAHLRENRHLLESSYLGEQGLEPTEDDGAPPLRAPPVAAGPAPDAGPAVG